MSTALAFAIVLASTGTASAVREPVDVAQLVRDACVATELRRSDFERLASERRWRPARITSQSGDQSGWNLVFRVDGGAIMLSHVPITGTEDQSVGTVCTISVEQAASSLWREVTALAQSLGFEAEPTVTDVPPGGVPVQIWSRFGDRTLTYAAAADGRATISLSRQFVTSETAPTSPPGN